MARILSIEDDGDLQHLIGGHLYREGYEMHYAWNGQEGYEKVLSLRPHLVLLDLMLPILNGIDFLRTLRAHEAVRDTPVVVMTAFGDEAGMLRHAMEALGAEAYLRKPVNAKELSACVRRLVARAGPEEEAPAGLARGAWRFDPRLSTLWREDRLVATLSGKEAALLGALLSREGPVPRAELLTALGYEARQADTLTQVVHRLRHSLGPAVGRWLRTVEGGYELLG